MDDGDEEGIDRLSDFPDHILLHILSFLDTKYSVQTSVLSTRWRPLWKQVNQLNFDRDSFRSYRRFKRFLIGVLDSLSGDDDDGSAVVVKKVSYKDRDLWRQNHFKDLDRAMAYVESHGIRDVSVHCGTRIASFLDFGCDFMDCELDSLELGRVSIDTGIDWIGFRILRSLVLEQCELDCGDEDGNTADFFAKFPCLKNLVLSGCDFVDSGRRRFKISGRQLLNLEIHGTKNLRKATVQIVAPTLKFLSFVFDSDDVPKFHQLRLPVLDHANVGIKVAPSSVAENKGIVTANFVKLFQGLQNATSLKLDYRILEAISKICDELKHQPCSFTRLKCLKLPRTEEPYSTMLSQLITYFLKGSSSANPVQLSKVIDN